MSLPPPRLPHPRRREAPGSPPLSPRGHCPPAPAKPMHPENKVTNHGKTGNGGAQSQHQNVNQGPTCNLGSKGVGAGNHGAKANQISPSNSNLKNTQAGVPPFSSLKGKVKRERSVSVDSGEQRESGTPSLDSEAKGTPFPDPQDPTIFHSPTPKLAGRPSFCLPCLILIPCSSPAFTQGHLSLTPVIPTNLVVLSGLVLARVEIYHP